MASLIHERQPLVKLPLELQQTHTGTRLLAAGVCVAIVLLIARQWMLKWSEKRHCAFGDLKTAGTPIPSSQKKKCAVIVGASISGILSGTTRQLAMGSLRDVEDEGAAQSRTDLFTTYE